MTGIPSDSESLRTAAAVATHADMMLSLFLSPEVLIISIVCVSYPLTMQSLITLLLCFLITSHVNDAFEITFHWQGWQTFLGLPVSTAPQQTLTPGFSTFIEQILESSRINGLSLSIVRKDGVTEYGAWGNKTEDGISVTPRVSGRLSCHCCVY